MKYTQDRFLEVTQNNPGKLKASGGAFPQGSPQLLNGPSAYLPAANWFGAPFIVDWQLSIEDDHKVNR